MNLRTLVTGAVVGILVYGGAYFLVPPPQAVQASDCATYRDVIKAVDDCMHLAYVRDGKIRTRC